MAGPSPQQRRELAQRGQALPDAGTGSGGRFPIRNTRDLQKAIRAVGRARGGEQGRAKVRRFIIKRARQLGATNTVPESWNADGSVSR